MLDNEFESIDISQDELMHVGTPHVGMESHSGRYKYGSGKDPYQRSIDFYTKVKLMKNSGLSDSKIAESLGISGSELKARYSMGAQAEKQAKRNRAARLYAKGYTKVKIAEIMGTTESNVRGWLKEKEECKEDLSKNTMQTLLRAVKDKGYIDVGKGVDLEMGVTKSRFDVALQMLKDKGYVIETVNVKQVTTDDRYTIMKVLAKPGTSKAEISKAAYNGNVKTIDEYSPDDGDTFRATLPPVSIDGKRVFIRYAEDGGVERDGTIELRPGVPDLSMGKSSYAQVRIAVDNKSYLKGMAHYSDTIPDGYDIVFNTNKHVGTPPEDVFKDLKPNADFPFGAVIKANGQTPIMGKDGKMTISAVNKIKEEGDWNHYTKSLPSQFLSKQDKTLIKQQLQLAYNEKVDEFNDIMSIYNPRIRKKCLEDFANNCDKAAEELRGAAVPGQSNKVILPVPSLKDNQIYAPTYPEGTEVALVRYPHAGTFEIPRLTVTHHNKEGKRIVGTSAIDAVGINSNVAEQLSGADFDGDTVVVLPISKKVNVISKPRLEQLKNFDPKADYPKIEGMKIMTKRAEGVEMGSISNLITDMNLKGADENELARAVKHSMVVIDAKKHKLNYVQSAKDNNIAELKKKYQGSARAGASTLISKATSEVRVPEFRKELDGKKQYINPETGEKIRPVTGRTYVEYKKDANGNWVAGKTKQAETKITKMQDTNDARTLLSKDPNIKEIIYAQYANSLKALANETRKEYIAVETNRVDPKAKATYSEEISSITAKVNAAIKNSPRERQAQIQATYEVSKAIEQDPTLRDKDRKEELGKLKQQYLARARVANNANKKNVRVDLTDKEWEAINADAVSGTLIDTLLDNADMDKLKARAMPKTGNTLSAAKANRIKSMAESNFTISEIAETLGVSVSAISDCLSNNK